MVVLEATEWRGSGSSLQACLKWLLHLPQALWGLHQTALHHRFCHHGFPVALLPDQSDGLYPHRHGLRRLDRHRRLRHRNPRHLSLRRTRHLPPPLLHRPPHRRNRGAEVCVEWVGVVRLVRKLLQIARPALAML